MKSNQTKNEPVSLEIYGLSKPYFQSLFGLYSSGMRSMLQKTIFFVFFSSLSVMKSSELFRALGCVGPSHSHCLWVTRSVVLVGGWMCFFRSWKLGKQLSTGCLKRSQVDLLRVRIHICTLIWERTHSFWCPDIRSVIKVLGRSAQLKKHTFLLLVPSLTKPNNIIKRSIINL